MIKANLNLMRQVINIFLLLTLVIFLPLLPPMKTESAVTYDEVIKVEMHQFYFNYIRQNGTATNDSIILYTGIAYLFNVTSTDVQHGLNIKGYNMQPLAGQYLTQVITFTTADIGVINVNCNHNCGTYHNQMKSTITVEVYSAPTSTTSNTTVQSVVTTTTTTTVTTTQTQNVTYTAVSSTTETTTSNVTQIQTSTVTATYVQQLDFPLTVILSILTLPVLREYLRRKIHET